jgi:hypothetical protein
MYKNILNSIVIGGMILWSALIYLGLEYSTQRRYKYDQNEVRSKNFTDCKIRGYEILKEYPESCKDPSGIFFINIPQLLATTTSTTIMYKRK